VQATMNQHVRNLSDPAIDLVAAARRIHRHCMGYRGADVRRSMIQLLNTVPPFFVLVALMGLFAESHYWASLILSIPAAGFLLRIFIIQHDCGHGSFLPERQQNDRLGFVLSLLTFTPYDHWRRSHATHHATSGNLDRRGVGDIDTLTVAEYRKLSPLAKLKYRLYRNLVIQLLIGAPVNFLILQRIPSSFALKDRQAWVSVMTLNAGLVLVYGVLMYTFGAWTVLKVVLPVVTIAAWVGGWLFYVQHQYESSLWDKDEDWDFHVASLMGSSHYVLPKPLQWITGNIGIHHIHHLCSGIPNYKLEECLKASPELQLVGVKLTVMESLRSIPLVLWDEAGRKMISFRQFRALEA
jgi:acyl-lipid omega-6 desaturase (Delta-12 desaturase)